MSADIWKVEYHVYSAGETSASYWFDDKDEAIAVAKSCGGRVEEVTSYLDDRDEIYNAAETDEEED